MVNEPYGQVRASIIEQLEYEADTKSKRITEIPSNMEGRWEYDSDGNCIYAGYAPRNYPEASDGWLIQKFTWVAGNCTKREINFSSWTTHTF